MTKWNVTYQEKAKEDLKKLDHSQVIQVLKAVKKVSLNPLPNTEGGYGKPLRNGNSTKLLGCCKIKIRQLGLRVVYQLIRTEMSMQVVVISVREDDEVYKLADERVKN